MLPGSYNGPGGDIKAGGKHIEYGEQNGIFQSNRDREEPWTFGKQSIMATTPVLSLNRIYQRQTVGCS